MAESDKTIILPDNQNGWNNSGIPLAFALNGNGWGWGNNGYGFGGGFGNGFFGGGFGAGILGGILGGLIPGFFGGWNGNGWGGNGNGAAAASLGAQATANSNAEMIMNAINGTDADVRLLATTLNGDVDSIRLAINTVQGAIQTVGAQLGLTGQQVINAIQQGDAAIASQLCQCCCQTQQQIMAQGYENQIRTVEQTNTLGNAISCNGQRTVDAIADLKTTMVKEFCDVKEREMQDKINSLTANNTLLRSQIDNANQTAQIASLIAPIAKEVNDIQCKLPNTVPVTYPNITAVNNTPNFNGYWGNGFGFGGFGGFGNGIVF